jgi:hypothetical protein
MDVESGAGTEADVERGVGPGDVQMDGCGSELDDSCDAGGLEARDEKEKCVVEDDGGADEFKGKGKKRVRPPMKIVVTEAKCWRVERRERLWE